MPTGNPIVDATTAAADAKASGAARNVLAPQNVPVTAPASNIKITPTVDPQSFIDQSKNILNSGFQQSGIQDLFGKVQADTSKAASSLNIIDEQYKQDELKRLPLDALQAQVDDMQTRRQRVLPEVLSDPTITDFNAKLRIASQLQSMFDNEITKTLQTKKDLETAAESRAKLKTDSLRAEASVYDKQLTGDQYALTSALDLYHTGTGSLQDILKTATTMQENLLKAKKGSGSDNPYIGTPGQGFNDFETALFLKADKNFGRLDVPDSVGKNQKFLLNQRYYQWQQMGKPVRRLSQGAGPPSPNGTVPLIQTILHGDDKGVNTFPQSPVNNVFGMLQDSADNAGAAAPTPQ